MATVARCQQEAALEVDLPPNREKRQGSERDLNSFLGLSESASFIHSFIHAIHIRLLPSVYWDYVSLWEFMNKLVSVHKELKQ